MARRGINAPPTSSAGRLFDAVAALLGVRDAINYEGQAAIELEQWADPSERGAYPLRVGPGAAGPGGETRPAAGRGATWCGRWPGITGRGRAGRHRRPVPPWGGRRHRGGVPALRERSGLGTVALSGGVFQNLLLLGQSVDLLEESGFRVLTHARVPPTTAASASARRWWPGPATAATGAERGLAAPEEAVHKRVNVPCGPGAAQPAAGQSSYSRT